MHLRFVPSSGAEKINVVIRFVIHRVVKMFMVVFWVVTPCELVGRYKRFRDEDGVSVPLQNVGVHL